MKPQHGIWKGKTGEGGRWRELLAEDRFFRRKNIPCLGFMPFRNPASESGLVHGIDERITIESLRAGIRALYELVYKLAAE